MPHSGHAFATETRVTDPDALGGASSLASLLKLSVEGWRLLRTVERFQGQLDADQQRRIAGRLNYFDRLLRDELSGLGYSLVDFSGQPFGPELAASAVNVDEFEAGDSLYVDQTVEPAVVGPQGLVKMGTVTLRRGPK